MDDFIRITSSVETMFEGENVELVCEAFLEDDNLCLPYNVTWRSSSLVSERDHQSDGHALLNNGSGNSLQMNGHVLRISRVSRTSRYCCLVHSDGETMEECIVISVTQLQPNGMYLRYEGHRTYNYACVYLYGLMVNRIL